MNNWLKGLALAWLITSAWISTEANSTTNHIQDTKTQIDNIISQMGINKLCRKGDITFYHNQKTNTSVTWVRSGYWVDVDSDGDLDFFVQKKNTHELRSWEYNYNWRFDKNKNIAYRYKTKNMSNCVPTNDEDRISKIEAEIKKAKS